MTTYSLAKRGTGRVHRAKLTRYEVGLMRNWARGDGYGLSLAEQVDRVQAMAQYHTLAKATIYDVLSNGSWHDPAYERGRPLALPATADLSLIAWFLFLVMLCRIPSQPSLNPTKTAISQ